MLKKSSDIFNESNFVFSGKGDFEEVFPEIEGISIKVTEVESLVWMKEQATHHLSKEGSSGEYIDCTNPFCGGGGFSMGRILRQAIQNKKEEINETEICKGMETMGRRCMHAFKISGSIKYKT